MTDKVTKAMEMKQSPDSKYSLFFLNPDTHSCANDHGL